MRTVIIGSITGIVLATVFLGMSEIVQSASAHSLFVITKSGALACNNCGGGGKPFAAAATQGGVVTPSAHAFDSLCGGKPLAFTPHNGDVCAP